MFEVYDDRTNEVVFSSLFRSECIDFLDEIDEGSEEFEHFWMR